MKPVYPVFLIAVVLFAIVPAQPAHAYLDPGTGSLVFQLLIGAVLGGIVTIKMYWVRIKETFGNFFSKDKNVDEDPDDA